MRSVDIIIIPSLGVFPYHMHDIQQWKDLQEYVCSVIL